MKLVKSIIKFIFRVMIYLSIILIITCIVLRVNLELEKQQTQKQLIKQIITNKNESDAKDRLLAEALQQVTQAIAATSNTLQNSLNKLYIDFATSNRPDPITLQHYMLANIEYNLDYEHSIESDYFQSPEETMRVGNGDCDDMAFLTTYILRKWGYDANVYIIMFPTPPGHAVTVFKGEVGYYMFDNQFLRYTLKETVLECIKELYPNTITAYKVNLLRYGYLTTDNFEKSTTLIYDKEEEEWETKYKYFKR